MSYPVSIATALRTFHKKYPWHLYQVIEVTSCLETTIYALDVPENCWFVIFLPRELMLCSSSFAAISRETGKLVCDGDLNDEG